MMPMHRSHVAAIVSVALVMASGCTHRTIVGAASRSDLQEHEVREVIEALRRASYQVDTSGVEWSSDSTVLEHIFSADYVRFGPPNARALRGEDFRRAMRTRQINREVSDIQYDQLQVATFDQIAVVLYRSIYRYRDGRVQAHRVTRTLRKQDGTWVIIAGVGMPFT
jgi:hypothetical protein